MPMMLQVLQSNGCLKNKKNNGSLELRSLICDIIMNESLEYAVLKNITGNQEKLELSQQP